MKQPISRPPPRSTSGGLEILDTGAAMEIERETLIDETCPNCGAELTCLEVRQPTYEEGDDLEPGDMVVYYTCFDCNWRGHVSADTDEILWEEIYKD